MPPPRSASRSDLPPRSVEERGGKGVRGEGAGEEEREKRERGGEKGNGAREARQIV